MNNEPLYVVYSHPVVHVGGYVGAAFLGLISIGLFAVYPIAGLPLLVAAGVGVLMIELMRKADRFALYEDGIAREYKLFSTKRTFAEYDSVQDIEITQSLMERILKIGTLHINTAGSHGQEIIFRGVRHCHEVEAAIRYRMKPDSVDTEAPENVR
jgi:uncharacterized membrane protein YdbT with pleckstrin-like domain